MVCEASTQVNPNEAAACGDSRLHCDDAMTLPSTPPSPPFLAHFTYLKGLGWKVKHPLAERVNAIDGGAEWGGGADNSLAPGINDHHAVAVLHVLQRKENLEARPGRV